MAAALQLLRHFKRLAVATAQTNNHRAIRAAKQREQDRKAGGLLFEQLVNDQIVVSYHGIDEADGRADLDDIFAAPFQSEGILDLSFDRHDFEQRMIEQAFELAIDHGMQIPELVDLDEVHVVIGQHKLRL